MKQKALIWLAVLAAAPVHALTPPPMETQERVLAEAADFYGLALPAGTVVRYGIAENMPPPETADILSGRKAYVQELSFPGGGIRWGAYRVLHMALDGHSVRVATAEAPPAPPFVRCANSGGLHFWQLSPENRSNRADPGWLQAERFVFSGCNLQEITLWLDGRRLVRQGNRIYRSGMADDGAPEQAYWRLDSGFAVTPGFAATLLWLDRQGRVAGFAVSRPEDALTVGGCRYRREDFSHGNYVPPFVVHRTPDGWTAQIHQAHLSTERTYAAGHACLQPQPLPSAVAEEWLLGSRADAVEP